MKQISCSTMGGPCDEMIQGNDPKELSDNGMKHLQEKHPDLAKQMAGMSKEDGEKWFNDTLMPLWTAAPEM